MQRNTLCTSMARSILASVEGTIAPAARDELASHLEICAACRLALAEQQGIKRLLVDLPLATVSNDFAARVRQRVSPLSWLDFVNWRAWTLRLAPVAALMIALLAWLPSQTSMTPSTSTSTAANASQTDTITAALESWAAGAATSAGSSSTAASASHLPMLLNPNVDGNALVAASFGDDAFGGTSR